MSSNLEKKKTIEVQYCGCMNREKFEFDEQIMQPHHFMYAFTGDKIAIDGQLNITTNGKLIRPPKMLLIFDEE